MTERKSNRQILQSPPFSLAMQVVHQRRVQNSLLEPRLERVRGEDCLATIVVGSPDSSGCIGLLSISFSNGAETDQVSPWAGAFRNDQGLLDGIYPGGDTCIRYGHERPSNSHDSLYWIFSNRAISLIFRGFYSAEGYRYIVKEPRKDCCMSTIISHFKEPIAGRSSGIF